MSKIWRIKRWLSLEQAADYIAMLIAEERVSTADLLQLALEGELQLSVVFPDGVQANPCHRVEVVTYDEVLGLDGMHKLKIPVGGPVIFEPRESHMFQVNVDRVVFLDSDEVFDLPMLGGELGDIQQLFWNLTGGSREETTNIDGTWVCSGYRELRNYFRLVDELPKTASKQRGHYPIGSLPENASIVLRQEEVRRFVDSLESRASTRPAADAGVVQHVGVPDQGVQAGENDATKTALQVRERNTYSVILAVLCDMAKVPRDQPSKAAGIIVKEAELKGWILPERTVSEKLRLIKSAIETRAK